MRRVLQTLLLLLAFCAPVAFAAEESLDWVENPGSQTIFFAVLEGLYTDGLSNAQVDRIIPPGKEISEHFVQNCPLCMPVIEALRLYRARPAFEFQKPKRLIQNESRQLAAVYWDHFRQDREDDAPLDPKLSSEDRNERIAVIQALVQKWVGRKLDTMRLNAEEEAVWANRFERLREAGIGYLEKYQNAKMADYANRKICPACDGSVAACRLPKVERAANKPEHYAGHSSVRPEIFFAVVEQLYRQGCETGDLTRFLTTQRDRANFSQHFVYACEICHSVFEALRLYHARPEFLSRKSTLSTFGPGLPPEIQTKWRSADARERRAAVQALASPALSARLALWRLTPDEGAAWSAHLQDMKKRGEKLLSGYQENAANNEPSMRYTDWKSCPSCDGAGGCKVPAAGVAPGVEIRPLKQLKNADEF